MCWYEASSLLSICAIMQDACEFLDLNVTAICNTFFKLCSETNQSALLLPWRPGNHHKACRLSQNIWLLHHLHMTRFAVRQHDPLRTATGRRHHLNLLLHDYDLVSFLWIVVSPLCVYTDSAVTVLGLAGECKDVRQSSPRPLVWH